MKLLVVEDDLDLLETIEKMLQNAGYTTLGCADGEEALYYLENNACDLVVLDRMLPGMDGLSVLRQARKKDISTPVLMLTAMDAIGDRVEGLETGADDYLVKPFDMRELLARVNALVRRPTAIEELEELHLGNIVLLPAGMLLKGPKGEERLTRKQTDFLALFLRNTTPTLTRATIFNRVWGPDADVDESIIDTYIAVLRRRMKSVGASVQIITCRGVGYRIEEQA